jgi:hypothetical protein
MPSEVNAPAANAAQLIRELQAQVQALRQAQAGSATKFPKPEPFDGAKGEVRSFLTQAKAYLTVTSGIQGPVAKILCIGNLLTGKAFEWWEPTLRDYLDNEEADQDDDTKVLFASYEAFEQRLTNVFGDPDEVRTATRKLKTLRQTGSAQHFAREFKRIASKLEWDDESQMELFYDGLREDVKDKLADKDRPDTFDKFVEMAIKIDNRNYARRLEKKGEASFVPKRNKPNTGRPRGGGRSTAYGHHAGPMDLDLASRDSKKKKTGNCYNCGKSGHYSNKCRQPKKQWKPVPERQFSMMERANAPVPHEKLHFSGCYQDDCLTHKDAKDNAGWHPQERRLCVMERSDIMDCEQPSQDIPNGQTDPSFWATLGLDPSEQSYTIAKTPSVDDSTSEEEEEEKDTSNFINIVKGIGRDVSDPNALRDLILNSHELRSEAHGPPPGSQWALHPQGEGHDYLSWFSCAYDSCPVHFWKKVEYRWFPKPQKDMTVYLESVLDKWEVVCKVISRRTIVLKRPNISILDLPKDEMGLVHQAWEARGRELIQGDTPELRGKKCNPAVYPHVDVLGKWKSWSEEHELATSTQEAKLRGRRQSGNDPRLK